MRKNFPCICGVVFSAPVSTFRGIKMTQHKHMPIFEVLRLVRDARSTKKADRELLVALALRCDPTKHFIAWPSYAPLALDTLLDQATLKRAAKRLEDAGLIKRVVRTNRSNHFFINVPLLQEQAAQVKAGDASKIQTGEGIEASPFEAPALEDAAIDSTDLEIPIIELHPSEGESLMAQVSYETAGENLTRYFCELMGVTVPDDPAFIAREAAKFRHLMEDENYTIRDIGMTMHFAFKVSGYWKKALTDPAVEYPVGLFTKLTVFSQINLRYREHSGSTGIRGEREALYAKEMARAAQKANPDYLPPLDEEEQAVLKMLQGMEK